jgi:hypothetical protein
MHEHFFLPVLYHHFGNMLDSKTLRGAAPLIAHTAALPTTDPNDDDFACFFPHREHDSSSWVSKMQ